MLASRVVFIAKLAIARHRAIRSLAFGRIGVKLMQRGVGAHLVHEHQPPGPGAKLPRDHNPPGRPQELVALGGKRGSFFRLCPNLFTSRLTVDRVGAKHPL